MKQGMKPAAWRSVLWAAAAGLCLLGAGAMDRFASAICWSGATCDSLAWAATGFDVAAIGLFAFSMWRGVRDHLYGEYDRDLGRWQDSAFSPER